MGIEDLFGDYHVNAITSVDDLPRDGWNFLKVLTNVPLWIVTANLIQRYWGIGYIDRKIGKGNRFGTPGLLFVLAGFLIDDVGTAIGMQAQEVPRTHVEGNPFMSGCWQYMIDNGYAKSQTDAHRLVAMWFVSVILASQYFGLYNSLSRVTFFLMAALKTYAGASWWTIKPNNYTLMDYLSFKPGRLTDERLGIPMIQAFNGGGRRRLGSTKGINWLTTYLPYIFPAL